ncbi:hypothetical protein BKA64DRAFT_663823 [Cadophora sp. MPI-SDFR-AT-0126]|nr:hypothetical protein BKA64DRAFT_663823 [Leotiomycetes sp. MPI-SDFR-AT-0126]
MAAKTLLISLMVTSAVALTHTPGLYRRELDEESALYIQEMCLPNVVEYINNVDASTDDLIPSLYNSPLPCEQQAYILNTCIANDTTAIDYLAEQQCICGSNFRETFEGCQACYRAHGYASELEGTDELVSSIWTAECSARPTQAFADLLFSAVETVSTPRFEPTTTLENDQFPGQTAVSNYWTGRPSASLGSITGSATARATTYLGDNDDDFGDDDDFPIFSSTSTSRRANFSYNPTASATPTTFTSTESSSDGSSAPTSSPITSTPVTAVSQASTTASTSTNGGGLEMGLAWNSGVVLVVVNVAVIALL